MTCMSADCKKAIGKIVLFALTMVFAIGVSAADLLMESGKVWLLMVMVFCPFPIGYMMGKAGWLDWVNGED